MGMRTANENSMPPMASLRFSTTTSPRGQKYALVAYLVEPPRPPKNTDTIHSWHLLARHAIRIPIKAVRIHHALHPAALIAKLDVVPGLAQTYTAAFAQWWDGSPATPGCEGSVLQGSVYLPLVVGGQVQSPPAPTSIPTAIATVVPATPTPAAPCACTGNLYNCSDFPTQATAQGCFDWCMQEVGTDVHRLDGDGNGIACESVPLGWRVVGGGFGVVTRVFPRNRNEWCFNRLVDHFRFDALPWIIKGNTKGFQRIWSNRHSAWAGGGW